MNTKSNIKNTFNKASKSYDASCSLQKTTGDKLLSFITKYQFTEPRIIDLGCGTGIVTKKLASLVEYRELHAIDFASHLLEIASQRLSSSSEIKVYHTDFDCLSPFMQPFDIIFSNMALHWSANFSHTLKSIVSLLNKNGIFAFTVPLPGTLNELQPYFSLNSFIENEEIINQLTQNECKILVNYSEKINLQFNNTFEALKSIKQVGANTTKKRLSTCLRGKSFINNIKINNLTYNIGYFVIRKIGTCQSNYLLPAQTQTLAKPTLAPEY